MALVDVVALVFTVNRVKAEPLGLLTRSVDPVWDAMQKKYLLLALMACCAGSGLALAQSVDGGEVIVNVSARKMALALAPVLNMGTPNAEVSKNVDAILEHGLSLSGLFDVVPQASYLPGLAQEGLAKTNYNQWFASGAQALVKVQYKTVGNSVLIEFALYDVAANKEIKLDYDRPSVTTSTYPKAVYAFVNAVIKYITGEPGFLGQTILATTRGSRGKPSSVVSMTTDGREVSSVLRNSSLQMLPAWGGGGSVLLTSYQSGNPDLYSVSGGKATRISSDSGMNTGASYCAGNGRIALTLSKDGNAEIYTMNSSGGDKKRLTNNTAIDTSPTWSPDCSKIAFVSDRGGNPQIYIMSADGSGVQRLTTIGKYNTNPAWGRGGQIAFSARDEFNGLDIFIIDSKGSDITRITQDQGKNDKPSWSPDGRYIAFSSTRDGGSRIYIATADGKSQVAATTSGWYENPVWAH